MFGVRGKCYSNPIIIKNIRLSGKGRGRVVVEEEGGFVIGNL